MRNKIDSRRRPIFQHWVLELFDIDPLLLKEEKFIFSKAKEFIDELDFTVLKNIVCNFAPFGTTIVFVLSSSHLIFHTWPEDKYIHIDLLSCSPSIKSASLSRLVKNIFNSNNFKIKKIIY